MGSWDKTLSLGLIIVIVGVYGTGFWLLGVPWFGLIMVPFAYHAIRAFWGI